MTNANVFPLPVTASAATSLRCKNSGIAEAYIAGENKFQVRSLSYEKYKFYLIPSLQSPPQISLARVILPVQVS